MLERHNYQGQSRTCRIPETQSSPGVHWTHTTASVAKGSKSEHPPLKPESGREHKLKKRTEKVRGGGRSQGCAKGKERLCPGRGREAKRTCGARDTGDSAAAERGKQSAGIRGRESQETPGEGTRGRGGLAQRQERREGPARRAGKGLPGRGCPSGPGWHSPTPYFSRLVGIQRAMPGGGRELPPPRAARLRLSAAARPQPPPPPRRAAWGRAPRAAPPCYENFPAAAQLSCLPRRAEPSLSGGEGGRGREEGREGGREAALSAPAGITCSRAAPPRGTDPGSRRGCCEVLMGHGGERETDANGEGGRLRVTAPVIATEYTEVGARRDFPAVGINTDYYFFKKVIR